MAPIGKIESVILNVKNVEKSAAFYSKLLGIKFEPITKFTTSDGKSCKSAWCPKWGFELIEQIKPRLTSYGVRGYSIRVPDVEKVKAKMTRMGLKPAHEGKLTRANEHEVLYNLDGCRFVITQHDDY